MSRVKLMFRDISENNTNIPQIQNSSSIIPPMRLPPMSQFEFEEVQRSFDYVRYATIGLAIKRILLENILGEFAEVGVYKGHTSKYIHMFAPDTTLYLFDTFEGFHKNDGKDDIVSDLRFKDTSVEEVLNRIGKSEKIVVRKGYFPETAIGLENKKFAFVMLDLDKYKPTFSGWEFFYPRVAKGGFIFVHDYNGAENPCHDATDDFLKDKEEKIFEIPDEWGSALIRKL